MVDGVLILIIATMLLVKLNGCGSSVDLNWTYVVEVCQRLKRKLSNRNTTRGIFGVRQNFCH